MVLVVWHFLKKIRNANTDNVQEPSNGHYNNITHNPKVLEDVQLFVISNIVISSSFVPYFVTEGRAPATANELLFAWMPMRLALGIIIPTLFFIYNKNLKLHAQREFWEWAPDYLQQYNPTLYNVSDAHVEQIEITPVVPVSSGKQDLDVCFRDSKMTFVSDQYQGRNEEEAETAL